MLILSLLCTACQRDSASPANAMGSLTPLDDARAPMPAPSALAIPIEFQGNWAESAQACGKPHEAQLQIGQDRLRFSESEGVIVSSTQDGRNLDLQIQLEGDGQTWQAHYRFVLSDGGNTLTDVTDKGPGLARVRCQH